MIPMVGGDSTWFWLGGIMGGRTVGITWISGSSLVAIGC